MTDFFRKISSNLFCQNNDFQNRFGREVIDNGWSFIFLFIKTRLGVLNPVGIDCLDVDSFRELKKRLCTVHSRNKIECMASGRTFS